MPTKRTITFQTETLPQHRINSQVYYFPQLRNAMVFIRLVKQTRENKNILLFFFSFESVYVETNNHEHLPHVHVTYG